MRVVLDAMGGDYGPAVTVPAAVQAAELYDVEVVLTGRKKDIDQELAKHSVTPGTIEVIDCPEVIETNDKPSVALRQKKNSSMAVAFQMVKNQEADAVISAGNTGALLAGGLFVLGRIKGISRPALAVPFPTPRGVSLLLDAGANADCKPVHLVDFALLGESYMKAIHGVKDSRIKLVNVGTEPEKGNELTKATYELLTHSSISFAGNMEARDIPQGEADVVVCDGFTGNIILKLFEGVAYTFGQTLKAELTKTWSRKIGAALVKPGLKALKLQFDYAEHGGVPFLGVNGLLIKAHGSSNEKAIKNAIRQAKIAWDNELVSHIGAMVDGKNDDSNRENGNETNA